MILALTLALVARDAGIGVPPWPLAPDGDTVAVFGDAPLRADGASVESEGGGRWRVVPAAGSDAVVLRAGSREVTVPVAQRALPIAVAIDPPTPIKRRDPEARVLVELPPELASAGPPRVLVSTGTMGPLGPGDRPGRWEARWQPSDTPQPEVLGIIAILPRCPLCATPLAVGGSAFAVASAIDLPGRSDSGVETRVEIAGRSWGPVRADADGRFTVPVVVGPGIRWASATSKSALGNEKRTKIDLRLSDAPGFLCATFPDRVPADGGTEAALHCTAWQAVGAPMEPPPLRAEARAGSVAPRGPDGESGRARGKGSWSARYRPRAGKAGADRIRVQWAQQAGPRSDLEIGLAPGAPATIEWRTEGEPAIPGSQLRVTARVLDAHGEPVGIAMADGRALEDGALRLRPELGDGVQRVKLSWRAAPGSAPAILSLGRLGGSWVAVVRDVDQRPVPGVALRFGGGAQAVTDARGEARVAATGTTETVEGPGGLRAAGWDGIPPVAPPIAIEREVRIALRPPGTVDVDAALEGGWIRWRVRGPDGAALSGRLVNLTSETVELGPVEQVDGGGRCAVRRGKGLVALEDAESGATTLLEVR